MCLDLRKKLSNIQIAKVGSAGLGLSLFYALKFLVFAGAVFLSLQLPAQDAPKPESKMGTGLPAPHASPSAPLRTTKEKWDHFLYETAGPLTFGGGAFNAAFSQFTHTDPKYGGDGVAFAERYGASVADIVTQNFFGDFVVASAFHEDPRYFRKGRGHSFWSRAGYAISRAFIIRKDTTGDTFNFDNVLGSAMSAGFSNIYYPPASRTPRAILMHFSIDVADNGFVNLAPEFWPDFRDKVLKPLH
jgi:hypothetical protein